MNHFLYNLSIRLFSCAVGIASLYNKKAGLFKTGRKNIFPPLEEWRKKNNGKLIWFHCASLGEFEQGRPVMEHIKQSQPKTLILLTFFSPSGYEVRKNYSGADYICYLPIDTPDNACTFMDIVRPDQTVFVKYEYWANYFLAHRQRALPLYVISAIFRRDQRFFGMQQGFWKEVLDSVTHFFLQDKNSAELLNAHGYTNYTIAGDTRFDRVTTIAAEGSPIPEVQQFTDNHFTVIVGSSYAEEENMLAGWFEKSEVKARLIIAPHEVNDTRIEEIEQRFRGKTIRLSELSRHTADAAPVLIVDSIGILSSLYRCADVAFIGGGFGKGIHNTLEAAVYGIPVIFGPNYMKFHEAKELIIAGGAVPVSTENDLNILLDLWSRDREETGRIGQCAGEFVSRRTGATALIMAELGRK